MSETSTPGHSGKHCSINEDSSSAEDRIEPSRDGTVFWLVLGPKNNQRLFACKYCPACGVRLVPDPEPLPKCPYGHTVVSEREPGSGWWTVKCRYHGAGHTHLQLTTLDNAQDEAESRWRKMMAALAQ